MAHSKATKKKISFSLKKYHASKGVATNHWVANAIKSPPGTLHKELHVASGKKIPLSKLKDAAKSKNEVLARRARLAETLRAFNHKHGK